MFKAILIFYIVCFALYIFFTRQPDYIDGEFTNGVIHYVADSNQKKVPKIFFTVDGKQYEANAFYALRSLKENENVQIIYDTSKPSKAAIYTWWGYWLRWDELLASIFFTIVLYFAATSITNRPAPESLIEELENEDRQKK